ncbi:hypothetical protein QA635_18570 [Bradyrhizobium brasilense]|uniref:hypothetical protein n=1 Tax=Bradyrhizobium brasilense TaxID=1419277 RepID=UPI0024B03F07|nr:hypothetical protein [Bradyrhizobium australafricanum]WFU36301.1 hypothetical protein QA635_18570 [Bradyrhizobium australafricanum]
MSRVTFIAKAEPPVRWSEVESGLHEISNFSSSLSGDLSIERLAIPANDLRTLIKRPASRLVGSIDTLLAVPPLSAAHDPLHTLSWPNEGAARLSIHQIRHPGFRAGESNIQLII